ncbi:hypothetical protein OH784_25080 [Ectobacillus funiculus]|uniref:hypothetical protein n=1 Tax=Ectobacillus funiculus TaxID=137993 RepID=UPI00397E67CA
MTIKIKMSQNELILSGVQVPTITPAPVSTALVQETSPTTAIPEKEVQEQIYKEMLLIEENQTFSYRTPPLSSNKNNGRMESINY